MSDNTLTGCWRLEQVGQHSSDEDDLFSSMRSRRYRGVRRVPSLCLSQDGSGELLSEYQKTVPKLNTGLPASAACEQLFSCAGLLFTAKRARMNSTHLENQLLLKLNKKFVD